MTALGGDSSDLNYWPHFIKTQPPPPPGSVGYPYTLVMLEPITRGHNASPHKNTSKFYGRSSGLEILRQMRLLLDDTLGLPTEGTDEAFNKVINALDRPLPINDAFPASTEDLLWLSKDKLLQSIDAAFSEYFCMWPVVDRMALDAIIEDAYNMSSCNSLGVDNDSIALLHAVVALGVQFQSSRLMYPEHASEHSDFRE